MQSSGKLANINYCWSHRNVDPSTHFDLFDRASWDTLLNCKPTHVILLSWPGLPNYQENFHVTRNLPACIDLIEQLAAVGLERIVIAGTCYEYGLQNGALLEDQLTDPVNCYAIAKDATSFLLPILILLKICNGVGLVYSIHLAKGKIHLLFYLR